MSKSLKGLRLRQLDSALRPFQELRSCQVPRRGWIAELRRALGMSSAQLGQRLGVTRQGVSALEHAEARGSVSLRSLRRGAEPLDCDLVYALVPRGTLEGLVDRQVRAVAGAMLGRASHSMALERQKVSDEETAAQVAELAERLRSEWPRNLWDLSHHHG